jgi:hypothetical protein
VMKMPKKLSTIVNKVVKAMNEANAEVYELQIAEGVPNPTKHYFLLRHNRPATANLLKQRLGVHTVEVR